MNKRFLLVAALCAAMNFGAFAQTNLAESKTTHASTNDSQAAKSVDGDTGTRWEVVSGDEGELSDDNYWYYVDLGEEQDFNVIQIVWEGGYAKAFNIYTANELDETNQQPKWGEEPVYTQKSTTIDNAGGKEITYKIGDQKARYVKIKATELGFSPYFSFWEFRVMKIELTATLKELNVSKDIVKVGETFTVSALDQFGKNMEGAKVTVTNAEKQTDGSYKANVEGNVVITAVANGKTITKTIQAYTPVITTLNVAEGFVLLNKETALTLTAKDQQGADIALIDATYTASNGATIANGKISATKAGKVTITATLNGKTATASVYALDDSMAPKEPLTLGDGNTYAIYGQLDLPTDKTTSWQSWEQTNINMEELTFGDKKVKPIAGGKKVNVGFKENPGEWLSYENTEFDNAAINVFPTEDATVEFIAEGETGKNKSTTVKLKAGKWQRIDLSGIVTENNTIKCINLATTAGATFPAMLISDIYLYKVPTGTVIVSEIANNNGFYSVTGEITTSNVAELKSYSNENETAFDLTAAKIGNDVTKIEFANPNALVMVAGSNTDFATANKLSETNNIITTDGTYFYAAKTLKFDDANAICSSISIDTSKGDTKGYEYTRKIAANAWVTTTPLVGADIPDGVEAYELDTENSKDYDIVLKKAENMIAGTPYVLHNTNNATATLAIKAEGGDFNPTITPGTAKAANATFHGNYQSKNGTEAEYGLQSASVGDDNKLTFKKIGTGATIGTFRAYFTLNDNTAAGVAFCIKFPGNGTTGIGNVNAVANAKIANGVYTLDGRKVSEDSSINNLPKGIYIVNGKKIVK